MLPPPPTVPYRLEVGRSCGGPVCLEAPLYGQCQDVLSGRAFDAGGLEHVEGGRLGGVWLEAALLLLGKEGGGVAERGGVMEGWGSGWMGKESGYKVGHKEGGSLS